MVQARNNSFGSFTFTDTKQTRTTTYNNNGSVRSDVTGSTTFDVHACSRGPKTSNHYKPIPGTGSLWRAPSDYDRFVWNADHSSGLWRENRFLPIVEDAYVSRHTTNWRILCTTSYWSLFGILSADEDLRSQAEVECLLKLGDNKVQLGVALAEAKATANLLADTASSLLHMYRSVRRGNWALAAKHLGVTKQAIMTGKVPASRLLEWQFGWLPLMTDIHGLHELLKSRLAKAMLLHARRTVKYNHTRNYVDSTSSTLYNSQMNEECMEYVTVRLTARVSNPYAVYASRSGLVNPLSIAWELVPFSFVSDWFAPVGNTLEALTATAGLTFVGGSRTERKEYKCDFAYVPKGIASGAPRSFKVEGLSLRRRKYTSFPRPTFYAKTSPFSTGKVITALALIRQVLFKR